VAQAYQNPGVSVREDVNPTLVATIGTVSTIALIGTAQGFQQATERVLLNATTPVNLVNTGVSLTQETNSDPTVRSPLVTLAATGDVIGPGNYIFRQTADPDPTITGDETYSLERITNPPTAPTVAAGTGTLTGSYSYAVSFVNTRGETGIGPASAPITLTAQGGSLTAIPIAPAQTGITWNARRVYRMKSVASGGDGLFHLVATINDNVTTTLSNESAADSTSTSNNPIVGLASGAVVLAAYTFTDNNYYLPTLFTDLADVVGKFGDAFNDDGTINSQLTFAARLAFGNGASEVMTVVSKSSSTLDFGTALNSLLAEEDVGVVVAVSGAPAVHSLVEAHTVAAANQGFLRIGIAGQDGAASPVSAATLRSAAAGLGSEAMVLVSPAQFGYANPVTGQEYPIGSQYVAACVAGMLAARDPQVPLTRKPVAAISSVWDIRTESDKQLDSSAGLLVVESKGGVVRIRHGITTAPGNPNTQEISVVRAKYEMARRLRETIDRSVIGIVASLDESPVIVQTIVTGILDQLVIEGMISGYGAVSARTLPNDPTTVEVRFDYTPAYPINRVEIVFRIDTTSGTVGLGTT
jgi:hypothetical protein